MAVGKGDLSPMGQRQNGDYTAPVLAEPIAPSNPELARRIVRAFSAGSATEQEQALLRRAVAGRSVRTVDDLAPEARQLLVDLEARGLGR